MKVRDLKKFLYIIDDDDADVKICVVVSGWQEEVAVLEGVDSLAFDFTNNEMIIGKKDVI